MSYHGEYIHIGSSGTGILMIHGILGSPRHFDFLIPFLRRHTVKAILLPGHGGDPALFGKYRMNDWREYVSDEAAKLRRSGDRFYICAHSMGGLLAMEEAEKYGADGLFLMAPPLAVRSPAKYISGGAAALSYKGSDPYILAVRNGCSIVLKSPSDTAELFAGYASMLAAAAEDRKTAAAIKAPVTAVFSEGDEIVNPSGGKYLPAHSKKIILRDASHNYIPPHERPRVIDELLFMLADK